MSVGSWLRAHLTIATPPKTIKSLYSERDSLVFHPFVLQYFHLFKFKCMHHFSCSSTYMGMGIHSFRRPFPKMLSGNVLWWDSEWYIEAWDNEREVWLPPFYLFWFFEDKHHPFTILPRVISDVQVSRGRLFWNQSRFWEQQCGCASYIHQAFGCKVHCAQWETL